MIIPSGKKRIMEAQTFDDDILDSNISEYYNDSKNVDFENIDSDKKELNIKDENKIDNIDEEKKSNKTLIDYMYKKLQEYGYPGRRLNEYKSKIVEEKIEADGTKEVKVEIPDKKYPDPETGEIETIEADDLNNIVLDIGKYFNLDFMNAHRSDGKWTIEFVGGPTSKINGDEDEEEINDGLKDAYGNTKLHKKVTEAFTIQELIKSNKDDIINKLKKKENNDT